MLEAVSPFLGLRCTGYAQLNKPSVLVAVNRSLAGASFELATIKNFTLPELVWGVPRIRSFSLLGKRRIQKDYNR